MASTIQSVQTFGRKKTAVAVAYCKQSKEGKGLIKLNGSPIEHVKPEELKLKVLEPILLLGKDRCGRMAHSFRARSCARALRGGAGARGAAGADAGRGRGRGREDGRRGGARLYETRPPVRRRPSLTHRSPFRSVCADAGTRPWTSG